MSAGAAPGLGASDSLRLITVASATSSPEVRRSAQQSYCDNAIRTAKYSYFSFIPM